MDEDLAIINENTRNEKIKNFLKDNRKKIIFLIGFIITIIIIFFAYREYDDYKKKEISNYYNSIITNYSENNEVETAQFLTDIIKKKDPTYSVLSLYFIVDNKMIKDRKKINEFFDIIIHKTSLEKEIKNLVIYKKALYNADRGSENQLLKILNPIINSESIWKSHALYLMAEYFYSKNEKEKSRDFFNQLIILENPNDELKILSQKRLTRDLSD
tara:strand:- start:3836 stop:4480 length:645 start_codon:yes stop_codon:yes gene_type:complete